MYKRSFGSKIFDIFNICFLTLLCFTMIFPLWNVLMTSLVGVGEYFKRPIILWPQHFNFESYKYIFSDKMLLSSFSVTVFITIVGTIYSVLLTTLMAYPLTKKNLPGRKFLLLIIMITMFFDGGLIPTYILIRQIHLFNTLFALILPMGISVWSFIITKTFFSQLPVELEESARIDGAGEFKIFLKIILPISLPVLATISLIYAVAYWNTWFSSLLYIQNPKFFTLQHVLREMIVNNVRPAEMDQSAFNAGLNVDSGTFDEGIKMATVIFATVPILIVYPFLQKYFVKGMMIGSIKG